MEVEHESFPGRRPVHRLPQEELTKKIPSGAYGSLLAKFRNHFPDKELDYLSSEEILSLLTGLDDTCKQLTRHTRYAPVFLKPPAGPHGRGNHLYHRSGWRHPGQLPGLVQALKTQPALGLGGQ
jgi:hypothetical protein